MFFVGLCIENIEFRLYKQKLDRNISLFFFVFSLSNFQNKTAMIVTTKHIKNIYLLLFFKKFLDSFYDEKLYLYMFV